MAFPLPGDPEPINVNRAASIRNRPVNRDLMPEFETSDSSGVMMNVACAVCSRPMQHHAINGFNMTATCVDCKIRRSRHFAVSKGREYDDVELDYIAAARDETHEFKKEHSFNVNI